jgi:hypothetical protein
MAAPASRKTHRAGGRRPRSASARGRLPGLVVFDVAKYGGKWVATRRGQIVAAADDFAAIRRAVRELGLEDDAILTRIPETGEYAY